MREFLQRLWAVIVAWFKSLFGKEDPPPPPPPPPPIEDSWPSGVKSFLGSWDAWKDSVSAYSPSSGLAIYKVIEDPITGIFLSQSSVDVKRPDGTDAKKHVFALHAKRSDGSYWNQNKGSWILCYRKPVPTTTAVWSKAYADGEEAVEIVNPSKHVLRRKHVTRVGFFGSDGSWNAD